MRLEFQFKNTKSLSRGYPAIAVYEFFVQIYTALTVQKMQRLLNTRHSKVVIYRKCGIIHRNLVITSIAGYPRLSDSVSIRFYSLQQTFMTKTHSK